MTSFRRAAAGRSSWDRFDRRDGRPSSTRSRSRDRLFSRRQLLEAGSRHPGPLAVRTVARRRAPGARCRWSCCRRGGGRRRPWSCPIASGLQPHAWTAPTRTTTPTPRRQARADPRSRRPTPTLCALQSDGSRATKGRDLPVLRITNLAPARRADAQTRGHALWQSARP